MVHVNVAAVPLHIVGSYGGIAPHVDSEGVSVGDCVRAVGAY